MGGGEKGIRVNKLRQKYNRYNFNFQSAISHQKEVKIKICKQKVKIHFSARLTILHGSEMGPYLTKLSDKGKVSKMLCKSKGSARGCYLDQRCLNWGSQILGEPMHE